MELDVSANVDTMREGVTFPGSQSPESEQEGDHRRGRAIGPADPLAPLSSAILRGRDQRSAPMPQDGVEGRSAGVEKG
jgi:hypothetical protein